MATLLDSFFGFFTGKKKETPPTLISAPEPIHILPARASEPVSAKGLPVAAGRSSAPANPYAVPNSPTVFEYREWLPVLKYLSKFHGDVSLAVSNLVDLGNTDFEFEFSDTVSSRQKQKMLAHLAVRKNQLYTGGAKRLISDLIRQLAVTGSLSSEMVVRQDLSGIEKIVLVDTERIYLFYDADTDTYQPHQAITNIMGFAKKSTRAGYITLNPFTYKYIPFQLDEDNPYGIPVFLSALESVGIERNMIKNFSYIMKKLGMFGLLSVLVQAPEQYEGETPEQYVKRCEQFLNQQAVEVEKSVNSGFVAGFKDNHEFKLEGSSINAEAAEKLMSMIDILKMAGLKQNPNLMGRQISTTETFGRVLLYMMTQKVTTFQDIVADFFSSVFQTELRLAGYDAAMAATLAVKFKPPMIGDELKNEQVEQLKLLNIVKKRNEGIISQDQAAQELGYPQPFAPGPVYMDNGQAVQIPDPGKTSPDGSTSVDIAAGKLFASIPAFDYTIPEGCNPVGYSSFSGASYDGFTGDYEKEIKKIYRKAVDNITGLIADRLSEAPAGAGQARINEIVMANLFYQWQANFVVPVGEKTAELNLQVYDFYRKDKSVFAFLPKTTVSNSRSLDETPLPEGVLGALDFRVLSYYDRHSSLYLGKFITDEDTRTRLSNWIVEYYIEFGNDIGKNEKAISAFEKRFPELMNLEAWKIRRITDTVVNSLRNNARLLYMEQALVKTYRIVEVLDKLTCPYCEASHGKTFSITAAKTVLTQIISQDPEKIKDYKPFVTTVSVDDYKSMDAAALEKAGFLYPPYHPSCRGVVTVDSF